MLKGFEHSQATVDIQVVALTARTASKLVDGIDRLLAYSDVCAHKTSTARLTMGLGYQITQGDMCQLRATQTDLPGLS